VKYVDEYRNERVARALAAEIARRVTRPWNLMEICGGQTHTIVRYGLEDLLPSKIRLIHGPGCPVCVTPVEMVDRALAIAARPEVTFASYGDMLRVPGSHSDLFHVKAAGGDVRMVYSPMDAIKLAERLPQRRVVFFGVGFETTAPANAMAIWEARRRRLTNFSMLVSHVLVPPAIRLLLESPRSSVDGLIAPGHVCTVMGYRQYEEFAREFHRPVVVGGFEPADLLEAIRMLVEQLEAGEARIENQYARSVTATGNLPAQQMMQQVFEVTDRKWRGIGVIPQSGLRLRSEFAAYDAENLFDTGEIAAEESGDCISAEILQGHKRPTDCPAFGSLCSPEKPMGAPMVSSEGACAAYYHYRRCALQ
jgi:hydrogenase expression/formation protein HypD